MTKRKKKRRKKERVRQVSRGRVTPLNRTEQPIILVPGIMGSRLHMKGAPGKPIWDPDDTWSMIKLADAVTAKRMRLFSVVDTKATVFEKGYKKINLLPQQEGRGWGGCAWGFYGRGLQWLQEESRSLGGVVYCFGYDWRQTNWVTGAKLKAQISKIRQKHGKKVLVVTHSMGGLVTRAACSQGAEADVLGVVHTLQPANGTPLAFRQWKRGGKALHWVVEDVILGRIVGRTPDQYAAVSSGTRGPYELLPNELHRKTSGKEETELPGKHSSQDKWLTWDRTGKIKHKLRSNSAGVYEIYKELTGRLGLIDYERFASTKRILIGEGYVIPHLVDGHKIHAAVSLGVKKAELFYSKLKEYVHPNTSVLAGSGLESDIATHLEFDWNLVSHGTTPKMIAGKLGDGTVALSSATCLKLNAQPGVNVQEKDRQVIIKDVKHAVAFGTSDNFNKEVWRLCQQVLKCG